MSTAVPAFRPQLAVPRRLLRLRSDAALAERFAAGDEAAFAVLYERHRPSVIAVCMGVLGSTHDAEDAAQEAFTALAGALRSAPPRELRAWLTRVARNAAIDLARRRRRTVVGDDALPDRPAGTADGRAELESVLTGIRELPESQRTALLMRELAGHSYQEIAALLEIDEEAVRGLIARARVGLRAHREASEMSCAAARAALDTDPAGRAPDRAIRRHLRACAGCRAYRRALRDDVRVLRGLNAMPAAASGMAGGTAVVGGLAAKGALLGGALTQVTAACAVSACAVGGVVLLAPQAQPVRHRHATAAHVHRLDSLRGAGTAGSRPASPPAARAGTAPGAGAAPPGASIDRFSARPGATSAAPGRTGRSSASGRGAPAVGHARPQQLGSGTASEPGTPPANRLGSAPSAPSGQGVAAGGSPASVPAPIGAPSLTPRGFGGTSYGMHEPLSYGPIPYAPNWPGAPGSTGSAPGSTGAAPGSTGGVPGSTGGVPGSTGTADGASNSTGTSGGSGSYSPEPYQYGDFRVARTSRTFWVRG